MYKVQAIVKKRLDQKTQKTYYFVKWEGYDSSLNTWEPVQHLRDYCMPLINDFQSKYQTENVVENIPSVPQQNLKSQTEKQQMIESNKGSQRKIYKKRGRKRKIDLPMAYFKQTNRQQNQQQKQIKKGRGRPKKNHNYLELSRPVQISNLQKKNQNSQNKLNSSELNQIKIDIQNKTYPNKSEKKSIRNSQKSKEEHQVKKVKKIRKNIRRLRKEKNQKSKDVHLELQESQLPFQIIYEHRKTKTRKYKPHNDEEINRDKSQNNEQLSNSDQNMQKQESEKKVISIEKQNKDVKSNQQQNEKVNILGMRNVEGSLTFYVETKEGKSWKNHQQMLDKYARLLCGFYEQSLVFQ